MSDWQQPGETRGRLITLEGGEGVGKSTNMDFLVDYLEAAGKRVVRTREPGGTSRAEKIRELLLDPKGDEPLDADAELMLVCAARAQHLAMKIRPALSAGEMVVSDRFIDATYAYQGVGRGLDINLIQRLESLVVGATRPDLTILLDMPASAARERVLARGATLDRFEEQAGEFFTRVRQGYLERAASEPDRIKVVDASAPLADVQRQISTIVDQQLLHWGLA